MDKSRQMVAMKTDVELEAKQIRMLIRLLKRDTEKLRKRGEKSVFVPEEGKRDMNEQKIVWGEELLETLRAALRRAEGTEQ
jgi:hypothetical protein